MQANGGTSSAQKIYSGPIVNNRCSRIRHTIHRPCDVCVMLCLCVVGVYFDPRFNNIHVHTNTQTDASCINRKHACLYILYVVHPNRANKRASEASPAIVFMWRHAVCICAMFMLFDYVAAAATTSGTAATARWKRENGFLENCIFHLHPYLRSRSSSSIRSIRRSHSFNNFLPGNIVLWRCVCVCVCLSTEGVCVCLLVLLSFLLWVCPCWYATFVSTLLVLRGANHENFCCVHGWM